MATFIAHGLVGAALTTAPIVKGTPLEIKTKRDFFIVGSIGFFLGSLPDVLDWLLATLGLIERWSLYSWFHHYMPTWMGILLLPTGAHVWIDKIFHKFPGYNWWPDLWYAEVMLWVIPILLMYIWYPRDKN